MLETKEENFFNINPYKTGPSHAAGEGQELNSINLGFVLAPGHAPTARVLAN